MSIRTRWPWLSILLSVILTLNPLGTEIIYAAFVSGESLSRGIWQPIALVMLALLAAVVLFEWSIRTLILNRRARGAATATK